jgi:hypothetical protein
MLLERGLAFTNTGGIETVRAVKERVGYVAANYDSELVREPGPVQFSLPDGNSVVVGHERFR